MNFADSDNPFTRHEIPRGTGISSSSVILRAKNWATPKGTAFTRLPKITVCDKVGNRLAIPPYHLTVSLGRILLPASDVGIGARSRNNKRLP